MATLIQPSFQKKIMLIGVVGTRREKYGEFEVSVGIPGYHLVVESGRNLGSDQTIDNDIAIQTGFVLK